MNASRQASILAGFLTLAATLVLLAPDAASPPTSIFDPGAYVARPGARETDAPGGPSSRPGEGEREAAASTAAPDRVRVVVPPRGEGQDLTPLRRLPPRQDEDVAAVGEAPQDIRGRLLHNPIAITAGRIAIGFAMIELPGIEPLELTERCESGSLSWPCGTRSRTELRSFLRGRAIRCEVPKNFGDTRETITSACTIGGDDVGAWVIGNGWARAAPDGPYADLEREAKAQGRGIWR